MAPFRAQTAAGVVVACSGGPDSLALALLARDWARAAGIFCVGVTVDHGLRPEAPSEADRTARLLSENGLPTTALHYDGPVPRRDIQAAARQIRYRLIADWLATQPFSAVLLAHHQDDQAETVLLRLARGSGVDGLSAMAPVSGRDGMTLLRPLLAFPKSRLEVTARLSGLPVVIDPSNRNEAFARVRLRNLSDALAAEGMTPKRLAETAARMARVRDALDAARDRFVETEVTADAAGFLTFAPDAFLKLPEEVGLRVLSQAVRVLGGRSYPPREAHLIALREAIAVGTLGGGRTLAGTKIAEWRGRVLICREGAGVDPPVAVCGGAVWDSRFVLHVPGNGAVGADLQLGALGREGVTEIRRSGAECIETLPGPVRTGLPALRRDGRIVSVPHVGYQAGGAVPGGEISFRAVSTAWGEDFQRRLPFSNPAARPM